MREAVIVSAVRSPVGKLGGGLSPLRPYQLGAMVMKEAVARAKVAPEEIDEVIYGTVGNKEMNDAARVVALEAGLPVKVPAIALDRQCGTSLNALAYAAILIQSGVHDVVVTGGVEMDSRRPWIMERADKAFGNNPPKFYPPFFAPPSFGDVHVLTTAENLAVRYGLTREMCDKFAMESREKAAKAWEADKFREEILPIDVPVKGGNVHRVDRDETPRLSTMEQLGKLRVATGKKDGVVTAGNSSPNCDGASCVVVMEKEKAKALGCTILATFRGYASAGVDPAYMGLGPAYAIPKLLKSTGVSMDEIDLFEINEAFASQSLACIQELKLDTSKLNVNGGAIALGHPLGATGGILTAKMVYELKRRQARYGVIAFCCGGGQGVAVLLEREDT